MTKKPKRPSVGERIAGNKRLSNYLISGGRKVLVPLINAAIRKEVARAEVGTRLLIMDTLTDMGLIDVAGKLADRLDTKYGVHL